MRHASSACLAAALLLGAALAQDAPAPRNGRVEIKVDHVAGAPAEPRVLYCGVPMPKGALADPRAARVVDEAGKPVPSQVRVLARWPGEKSIRWLGVDYLAAPSRKVFLEFDAAGSAASPSNPAPFFAERKDSFVINTGPASFIVPKAGPLFAEASLDLNSDGAFSAEERIIAADAKGDLYVVDNKGRLGLASLDKSPGQSTAEPAVEEMAVQGSPLHACVRREGWYLTSSGQKLARHITRLHFRKGSPAVRVVHTLVLTEPTDAVWFRDIGLRVPYRLSGAVSAAFDDSHEFSQSAFAAPLDNAKSLFMFQEKAFHMSRMDPAKDCRFLIGRADAQGKTQTLKEGERCGEWAAATDGQAGLGIAIRDLWQQHPKELEVAPGAIIARLWSNRAGRELDLRTESLIKTWPTDWFNDEYHGKGSYGSYYTNTIKTKSDAVGMAKTHELLLMPFAGQTALLAAEARELCQPTLCLPDPVWSWRSNAFGAVYPRDTARFPKAEGFIEAFFDQYFEIIKSWGDYGFIDFGSGPHVWYRQPSDGALKGRWMPYVARYSGAIDYGFHTYLWPLYMRSGQRKYVELAEEMNRHRMDICMVHWDGANIKAPAQGFVPGKHKGALSGTYSMTYWGNHSILHHQSGTDVRKLYYYYYLRDYRRAHDVAEELRDLVKKWWKQSQTPFTGTRPTAVLNVLACLYQETGDPEILEIGRERLKALVDLESPRGVTDKMATGLAKYGPNIGAMCRWYEATGDDLARRSVLRGAETLARSSMGDDPFFYTNTNGALLSLAWRLTSDPMYLRHIRRSLDIAVNEYFDDAAGKWKTMPVTSASNSRFPMDGVAQCLSAIASAPGPVEPTPVVQQSGMGRPVFAVFRKPAGQAVVLDVRSRLGLAPRVRGLDWTDTPGVITEPFDGFIDYTTSAQKRPWSFRITVPASAPEGGYVLDPGVGGELWELTWTDAPQVVCWAPGGLVTGSGRTWQSWPPRRWLPGSPVVARPVTWLFQPPAGAKTLRVFASSPIALRDSQDKSVAQAADKTGWFEVPVSGAGLWRFAADRDTFVEIPGVSIFAADLPGRHFVPDMSKAPAARLGLVFAGDKPAAGDAPGRHGRASGLAARGAVTLDLGRDLGKGRFERFNPDQGTLEFWLRPARSGVHEPRNTSIGRNLLEAGPWSITLYPQGRRSLAFEVNGVAAPGPKAAKAEDDDDDEPQGRPGALSAQASLSLEADRWTHLAFQWRRDGAGFILEVYVDGRLNGVGAQAPHKAVSADNWTPKPIAPKPAIAHRRSSASPTLDAWIDDLRLSSAPRYNQDFTPPAQPFTKDPQTLILLDFDSND